MVARLDLNTAVLCVMYDSGGLRVRGREVRTSKQHTVLLPKHMLRQVNYELNMTQIIGESQLMRARNLLIRYLDEEKRSDDFLF